ncbi:carbohydrate-binding module family 50 protein [Macrolepiota fuliginosa MF-IS2]|uniref:Carbohydrate-binding module family 50 protein n=1 Tax=Macrolepiota fuliginosa MF-IS2 TaxID=1400762 RepID=A0A9P6C916_9AGAR|nr:carbohydrate-binding module family 50 protein [Macrolepiota fuliginosa MF-IS2]
MHDEDLEDESRAYYASALHPKHSHQPAVRRRHSGSTSESNNSRGHPSNRHGRSRTDSSGGRSNGGNRHPLTSPRHGPRDSAGVTRPHLSRTIRKMDDEMRGDDEDPDDDDMICHKEEEKEVIVHKITPDDSLAGVSLKYGINMADLRRANHLWANDSIHLRNLLYIPVDKSSKARELAHEMRLKAVPLIDISTSTSSQSSDATTDSDTDTLAGLGLKRVPVSEMSFFPPPSTSGKTPSISSTPSTSVTANLKPPLSRYSTSPSLASILTALPIAASTRDDLLARLSFDSARSSFSDRSRPSLVQLEGHELDVVSNHVPKLSHVGFGGISVEVSGSMNSSDTCTPKARHHEPTAIMNTQARKGSPSRGAQPRHLSTTPPVAYIPQIQDRTAIRTVQMEPSPMMQLPTLRPRKSQISAAIHDDSGRH